MSVREFCGANDAVGGTSGGGDCPHLTLTLSAPEGGEGVCYCVIDTPFRRSMPSATGTKPCTFFDMPHSQRGA